MADSMPDGVAEGVSDDGQRRTVVHLVRHGEVHNPTGVLYGRMPGFHLSELGQQMADRLAKYFSSDGKDVSHLVASPLERAQQTAQPTADALGCAVCSARSSGEATRCD